MQQQHSAGTGPLTRHFKDDARLRIVIPACNEALRIGAALDDYCSHFGSSATILVVANGCTDDTAGVVRQAQQRYTNLELIEIHGRVGKGCAVRAGFTTGNEPFVGFTDADGSTSAKEFARIYEALRTSNQDGVIASRWLPESEIHYAQGLPRRLVSRAFNLMTRALFGLRFADTQCGSKVFRRDALAHVVESLEHAGFAFDVELLWSLRRSGYRVSEFPIAWSDRAGSNVHIVRTSWSMFTSVLHLRLRDSWFLRVRFIAAMGRKTRVPVRASRRVLLLGTCPPSLASIYDLLRAGGLEPVAAHSELYARWPWAAHLRDGWLLRALFFAWYAFVSDRDYDAVLEFEETKPWFVPAFSIKPTLLIKTDRPARAAIYDWFYKHSMSVDLNSHAQADGVDAAIALLDTRHHPAVFVHDRLASKLCYRNASSGNVEHLILR